MTLPRGVEAVNLGLSTFADALRDQGAPVVDLDWRPPAADLVELLTRLWGAHGDRVAAANARGGRADRGRRAVRGHGRAGRRAGAGPA